MCQCNPSIKTPWCGKGNCVPTKEQTDKMNAAIEKSKEIMNRLMK